MCRYCRYLKELKKSDKEMYEGLIHKWKNVCWRQEKLIEVCLPYVPELIKTMILEETRKDTVL